MRAARLVMPYAPPPPPLRPFARPMLVAALALGVGIAAANSRPGIGFWTWTVLFAGCGLAIAGVAWRTRHRIVALRGLPFAVLATLSIVAVGGARMAAWATHPDDHIAHAAVLAERLGDAQGDATLTLWGWVDGPPQDRPSGVRLVLDVDSAARGETVLPVRGRVQLRLAPSRFDTAATVYPRLQDGDRMQVTGPLRSLPTRRNPADMDYGAYLARQGIYATMNLYDGEAVTFLGPTRSALTGVLGHIRSYIRASIARFVRTTEAQAVLHALLLADRSGLDERTRTDFAETGLTHLLAVSGLHVLLVGLLLYRLLKPILGRLGFRWRTIEFTRSAITLTILLGYVLVTGGTVSVVRAFIMALVWIVGAAWQKPSDGLNTLGVAAVILLMMRPAALFDVGFQLSFGAVGALVTISPLVRTWFPERWYRTPVLGPATSMTVASIVATLGTGPVLLYHFGQLPLAGLILNLIAIPATAIVLFGGLACVAVAGWLPWAADAFAGLAEFATAVLLTTSQEGATYLGWSLLSGYVREPLFVLAAVLGLLALALWLRPRLRWGLVTGAMLCTVLALWDGVLRGDASPHLDVVFLDVGQGDATLLSFPDGRHLLVDAGLRSATSDAGRWTVLPHLKRYSIERLDAVVLTHPDADHYGGILTLLREVEIGRVVHNGHQKDSPLWLNTLARMDSLGIPQQLVTSGDTLDLDPSVRIRVLSPPHQPPSWDEGNDHSVVLRVEYGTTTVLLTGDAEANAETRMAERYSEHLASTVVKIGHHGSRTSSIPAFVGAASDSTTQFAVVSVARRNRYGLPDEEPLARWEAVGATVLSTAQDGAIWLRSDGEAVRRVDWR